MFEPEMFFDLSDPMCAQIFQGCKYVWEPLKLIEILISQLSNFQSQISGNVSPQAVISDRLIYIAPTAVIEPGAYILGPTFIGNGVVVRHGAYVRENVIMLDNSMLGHASEAKNSIFLNGAHAPHFNYVGDSILGKNVNLGAGTKLSNLTMISEKDAASGKRATIKIPFENIEYDTGLSKIGAILGDESQSGCNSVLNPGAIVGPRTLIYPNLSLRKGYHPADSIIKLRQQTSTHPRRN